MTRSLSPRHPLDPIPPEAATQLHRIEGGPPRNVDLLSGSDRHLLIIDCAHDHLYELYELFELFDLKAAGRICRAARPSCLRGRQTRTLK